jgi:hypothetical protein
MATPITKAQVVKALREAISRTPDAINPSDGYATPFTGCVYHTGRGKNIRRCLIGQIGFDLGLPTPSAEAAGVGSLCDPEDRWGDGENIWRGRFTPGAVDLMSTVQAFADGNADNDYTSRPWREVRNLL